MSLSRIVLYPLVWLLLAGCASKKGREGPDSYYQVIGWSSAEEQATPTDFKSNQREVVDIVTRHRYIINADDALNEIQRVSPAQFNPSAQSCGTEEPLATVILVHGLSDTAYSMQDIGKALANRCYLASSLLLPGHSTVPGDLLATQYTDWIESVRAAVVQASVESEHVTVIGFSLGAVLGLHTSLGASNPPLARQGDAG